MVKVGLGPHSRVGVYGANSPEWMVAMQVGAGWVRWAWTRCGAHVTHSSFHTKHPLGNGSGSHDEHP